VRVLVGVTVAVSIGVGVGATGGRYITTSLGRRLTVPKWLLTKLNWLVERADAPRSSTPLLATLPSTQLCTRLVRAKLYQALIPLVVTLLSATPLRSVTVLLHPAVPQRFPHCARSHVAAQYVVLRRIRYASMVMFDPLQPVAYTSNCACVTVDPSGMLNRSNRNRVPYCCL